MKMRRLCNRESVVIDLHPGADYKIRVVIKTDSNVIKRPIIKLCKLPIDDVDQN